jgi:hypothetical protein
MGCRNRKWKGTMSGLEDESGLRGEEKMDINDSSEVYGRITRVINELKMARQSVTIFKVVEMTGIDQFVVFQYFYEKGLLKGK